MALPEALAALTERERAIFDAGVSAGAAQQLHQIAMQHSLFVKATVEQTGAARAQALKALSSLPTSNGARAGAELGRRVVAAGKALLGKR
jgi:hypothetical protein